MKPAFLRQCIRKHTHTILTATDDNKLNENVNKTRKISLMAPVDDAFNRATAATTNEEKK